MDAEREKLFLIVILTIRLAAALQGPIDLSWPYEEVTSKGCAGGQGFQFLKKVADAPQGVWYAYNTFAVAEHCGTHIDAPYHFDPEGLTVDNIPLEKLLVTGIIIDVSEQTGNNENYTMPLSEIESWEKINGPLPENSVVIIRFGWSSKYHDKEKYIMKDGVYRHPGFSPDATNYLIKAKKVVGVGVDGPSVDPGYDPKFPSHVALCKAGIYILENMAIISPLPPKFKMIIAPMKIAGGTGGPTRVLALPLNYTF